MLVVPAETPVTTPVPEATVAFEVLLLDQAPPDGDELKVVVLPTHVVAVPVMAAGVLVTLTSSTDTHPLAG
jgi:hypothetical protein